MIVPISLARSLTPLTPGKRFWKPRGTIEIAAYVRGQWVTCWKIYYILLISIAEYVPLVYSESTFDYKSKLWPYCMTSAFPLFVQDLRSFTFDTVLCDF